VSEAALLVTGANGRLGRTLIRAVAGRRPVRALVRSERAAASLRTLPPALVPEIVQVDWSDPSALAAAGKGASDWVHLVGVIKETRASRYADAHERPAQALAAAAREAGARRVVAVSILGADPASANACLASRGRADAALLSGAVPATILRVPMVLGPGEPGALALRAQATARVSFLVRGGATWEQPIDRRDLASALERALSAPLEGVTLDLAGPEALSHRALVLRTAALLGRRPRIVPLPLAAVSAFAAALERFATDPPLTRAMLGVLEHDDRIDPFPAAARLGLELTPLERTLAWTFLEAEAA
jgi:NADH dehydrogenase